MAKGGRNALQFEEVVFRFFDLFLQTLSLEAKNSRILFWIDGETVLVIKDAKFTSSNIEHQFELRFLEFDAVLIRENRNQNFVLQFVLNGVPVNIEKLGIL